MRKISILLAFGIVCMLTSCGDPSDAATSAKDSKNEEVKPIEVTAEVLSKAYDDNEVSADNSYKGKTVKISGTIADIGKDIMDDAYITLKTQDENAVISIQCMFKDKNVVAGLKKDQQITLKGKVTGKMMNVLVEECELTN